MQRHRENSSPLPIKKHYVRLLKVPLRGNLPKFQIDHYLGSISQPKLPITGALG